MTRMARRVSRPRRLRRLTLALVLAGSLTTPVGISAQAAEDETSAQGTTTGSPTGAAPPGTGQSTAVPAPPTPDSSGTPPSAAPPAPPSAPPPTSVTVARANASDSKSVSILDFSFNPGSITVNRGDTVQWTNNGKVPEGHDVTGDGLDSGLLHPGDSYAYTFKNTGSFSYICTIHPSMKGTVKVLGRSSGNSGANVGSDGSGSGGSGSGSSGAAPTGAGSEPAAVSSPDAGGSAGSLPATGSDSLRLATVGLMLLNLGLALRVLVAATVGRRRT
jgi:plastocyanin